VAIERLTLAGEVVVVEWETTGTFSNAFRGREPNGKRFRRRGCAIADLERGLIVRYRDYYDRAFLLQQLELIDLLQTTTDRTT
jgi:ketosteroid isomerase-like protein